ncbi:MAG: CHAT domain-containing protein [Anaerolineales bacterium]|nr:CHAT domain-containing protein [Anaerolineales bacterium]
MATVNRDLLQQVLQDLIDDENLRQLFFTDKASALSRYSLNPSEERWFSRINSMADLEKEAKRFEITLKSGSPKEVTPLPGADTGDSAGRLVNTGFASFNQPQTPLDYHVPLNTNQDYYFWLEVGELIAGAIDELPQPLPPLPPNARLQVVLFPFASEFALTGEEYIGELKQEEDGAVRVSRPATRPRALLGKPIMRQRLFFLVHAPPRPGAHRLRCNIYYQQLLIQSHLVTMQVAVNPQPTERALSTVVDYTLSHTLDIHNFAEMESTKLSLMLNDNGNGSHGFRFFGEGDFQSNATLSETALQDLIEQTRQALRMTAWGDDQPYNPKKNPNQVYRYQKGKITLSQLRADLIRLARNGYRFYDTLITQLAGDKLKARQLRQMMLNTGQVQIATKQAANQYVPAALFYDYRLDANLGEADYELCPTFVDAITNKKPLAETPCFHGNCPTQSEDKPLEERLRMICPSGFWGFRHNLGMPLSIASAPDAPSSIPCPGAPEFTVGAYQGFQERAEHEKRLQALQNGLVWHYASSRDDTLKELNQTKPHVVYFYCHGGVANNVPFILVGKEGERGITRDNLDAFDIFWEEPRPLVFINGCHTTALEPEQAINLVSGFVESAYAAGVIGTEITIFEPIAVAFAEEFFARFVTQRQPVGEAIRGARLKMLEAANPLGLVYIPYVMPGLKLG